MASTLSLRESRTERQNKELKLRQGLLERWFEVGHEVLVAKGIALGTVKASAFNPIGTGPVELS